MMKNKFKVAAVKPQSIIIETNENISNPIREYESLTPSQKLTYNNFILLCNEICVESMDLIPIPDEECIYTMIKPCPVNGDLEVRVWERGWYNDKDKKIINIDIIALHFDSQGNRVPLYDSRDVVIADMSEERRVEITEGVYEYSYVLGNAIIENGEPVKTLIAKAIQIADVDGTLNKRLYGDL